MIRKAKQDAPRRILSFTWNRWRQQPWRVAALILLVLLSTAADVGFPVATGVLVDTIASPDRDSATAWTALAIMLVLAALSVAAKVVAYFVIIEMTLLSMRNLVMDGFARIQRLPTAWHANNFGGSTVRKVTRGAWAMDDMGDMIFLALLPAFLALVGTAATLAFFRPELGVIAFLGSALFIAVSVMLSARWVAPAASLSNAQDSRMSGAIADAITSNAVVKAHAAEAREEERLARVVSKWAHRTNRTWRRGTVSGLVQDAILWILRVIVLGGAVLAWSRGLAGPGEVAFAVTAFATLQGYLRSIGQEIRALQRAINDMEELVDLMQAAPEELVAQPPTVKLPAERTGTIVFRNVSYGYSGAKTPLFTDLNLSISAGQRVGLVGRSGSGKTTFVKLLQRLHEVTAGQIELDGVNIASLPLSDLRQSLAVVAQEPILFHRSLADNIAYARPGAGMDAVRTAADRAGAAEFIDAMPKGYGTLVGERGVKLSGGERQRIAIARAFLSDAPVLVMDEATSSLDSEAEAKVAAAAERLMEGRTTLIIAHRLATVAKLDRLLVFDKGRIVEDGMPEELLTRKNGLYRALHQRQAGALAA
ncbi:ABC transporter ATP-binding protein [Actibacterium sp. 188UL27-1]|uniref:ABC transporter ATP-binding protein n=1 Tax=Actibacterium sp. 188UL27-1 TaxID=2786961 RepID=UPI00195BBD01|nr:ABC transporter ATP-binding protein [Actibacterium sp. 188UL27-1]MBM7070166.1 ABC transporter ATP-binding protein [Actibacterium sp. 188UL27-1]